jgi:hypothetical protein
MIPVPSLVDGLQALTDTPRKQGLGLRPPKHLLRLLHLAREYAAAVAFRPISFGNIRYLHERVQELHVLGKEIDLLRPSLSPEWERLAGFIAEKLQQCKDTDSQRSFAFLVEACDRTEYRRFWERETTSVPAYRLPVLTGQYTHIVIATGPALGLGDEIACDSLVRQIRRRWPKAEMEAFGFYPGLWSSVDESIAEHAVNGSPLRAFLPIETAVRNRTCETTLVVFINFTGLYFHRMYCMDSYKPDIVEIAVGRGTAWFVPGGGGPVQVLTELDPVYPNNYTALYSLTEKLIGPDPATEIAASNTIDTAEENEYRIVINPLTSKPIILTPRDWAMLIEGALASLDTHKRIRCILLPGLARQSWEYAQSTVEEIRKLNLPYCTAEILNGDSPLETETAFRRVRECIASSHLLIGVDTSTAHLAPMLSIPSIALCYERNIAFWAPYEKAFWVELRHSVTFLREVIALVMMLTGASRGVDRSMLRAASALPSIASRSAEAPLHEEPTEELLSLYDDAWNALPSRLQKLLVELDGNYTWSVIRDYLPDLLAHRETRLWLHGIIRQLHFSKVCALLEHYGRKR